MDANTEFSILNVHRQPLLNTVEDTDFCIRSIWGRLRPIHLFVKNLNGEDLFYARRKHNCCRCGCRFNCSYCKEVRVEAIDKQRIATRLLYTTMALIPISILVTCSSVARTTECERGCVGRLSHLIIDFVAKFSIEYCFQSMTVEMNDMVVGHVSHRRLFGKPTYSIMDERDSVLYTIVTKRYPTCTKCCLGSNINFQVGESGLGWNSSSFQRTRIAPIPRELEFLERISRRSLTSPQKFLVVS